MLAHLLLPNQRRLLLSPRKSRSKMRSGKHKRKERTHQREEERVATRRVINRLSLT